MVLFLSLPLEASGFPSPFHFRFMPCKFLPVEPWKSTLKPAIGVQSISRIGSAFAALFVSLLCIFLSWTFRLLLLHQPKNNR